MKMKQIVIFLWILNLARTDKVSNQLLDWKKIHTVKTAATNEKGVPMPSLATGNTFHPNNPRDGADLLFDTFFIDHLAQFDRQRIPERVVHAKGAGAHGYFEVTHDISKFTNAKFLSTVGKRTPCFARFSTVNGESGSADTAHNPRGFAVKFYTEDGNYDFVGLNFPIFSIRDPILFPALVRSRKKNPVTNLKDKNLFWDMVSLRPETLMHSLFLFGPDAHPDGFRFMHGFAIHAFKMVNEHNQHVFVKLHMRSDQGVKYLSPERSEELAGSEPDYATRDLYNAIAEKNYPTWTFSIQVMTEEQAKHYRWNAFDPTKMWRLQDFPLIPVGKLVLNRNPTDFFSETEQVGFDPGNLVPGLDFSPDLLLQGRIFSYLDTQRYRLGTNFNKLPINHPLDRVHSYARDGHMCFENGGGAPNYHPNSFNGAAPSLSANKTSFKVPAGEISRHDSVDEDNFSQPTWYWRDFISAHTRQYIIKEIAKSMKAIVPDVRQRAIENYGKVDKGMERALIAEIAKLRHDDSY